MVSTIVLSYDSRLYPNHRSFGVNPPTRPVRERMSAQQEPQSGRELLFRLFQLSLGCGLQRRIALPVAQLEISPHSTAVVSVLCAIMLAQVLFFTQNLPMEQPPGSNHVDQENPIWKQ